MHIQEHINLHPYTTFQLDCIAKYFVEVITIQDVKQLITTDLFKENKYCIVGGGSNILFTQAHYTGLIIKNSIMGKDILEHNDTTITIRVGAGENWNELVEWSLQQGYTGIENLIRIPGTVGAAPMQNIGAYGVELEHVLVSVEYIDLDDGNIYTLHADACELGYRTSVFKTHLKGKVCISHVTLKLCIYDPSTYQPHIDYGAIQQHLEQQGYNAPWMHVTPTILAQTIAAIRAQKLPDWTKIGTAGSFFKNPSITKEQYTKLHKTYPTLQGYPIPDNKIKLSAGQLIDMAGCKGIQQGPVGTYKEHALVLVHYGGGNGNDIVTLAQTIQERVYNMFGILLEPEVNYV